MNRIALVGIIVENLDSAARVNEILHTASTYIIGRMGVPYRDKNLSIISIIVDAPQEVIAALSGKLGGVPGVQVKVMYTQVGV